MKSRNYRKAPLVFASWRKDRFHRWCCECSNSKPTVVCQKRSTKNRRQENEKDRESVEKRKQCEERKEEEEGRRSSSKEAVLRTKDNRNCKGSRNRSYKD